MKGMGISLAKPLGISLVPKPEPPYDPRLKFTSSGNSNIRFEQVGTWSGIWIIETSTDGLVWSDYTLGTTINLTNKQSIYFRGTKLDATPQTASNYRRFVMNGPISASGDLTCMLNRDGGVLSLTPYGNYTFESMFENCTELTSAPSLPSTTLTPYCYEYLFYGCVDLIEAPELPATNLTTYCYRAMFRTTGLVESPVLPATTLAPYCYANMFSNNNSIRKVTCLATNRSASGCTNGWLNSVYSVGDFYGKSAANWPTSSESGIPSGWTAHLT